MTSVHSQCGKEFIIPRGRQLTCMVQSFVFDFLFCFVVCFLFVFLFVFVFVLFCLFGFFLRTIYPPLHQSWRDLVLCALKQCFQIFVKNVLQSNLNKSQQLMLVGWGRPLNHLVR